MEKIKVNMSPNPLDVQTIHASQNDGEARQWEFELHNNGELIDTSEVTEQMVFKSYKGGTEQLLPENTSTPTTSPFKGDIKYPQGELTDQEFTYRQSPTESDGLAKITDIKGNTLVWNQLNQNGNYPSTSGLSTWGCTISASNNILTFKATNNSGNYAHPFLNLVSGHKYLVGVTIQKEKAEEIIRYGFEYGYNRTFIADNITTKKRYFQIVESTYTGSAKLYIASVTSPSYTDFGNVYVSDYVCFDLTQMGLDSITDPSEFSSLFSLPYYAYNQGTLLSFMGNGIKTVGKNLFDEQIELGTIDANGNNSAATNRWRSKNYIPCFPNTRYVFSKNGVRQNVNFQFYDADKNYLYNGIGGSAITTPSNAHYLRFFFNDEINVSSGLQLEFGTSATEYEPYTSSTLSLPISTYFPTGMKSAGSVYDELTESKAITRVTTRVLNGTENWVKETFQGVKAFYIRLQDGTYANWNNSRIYCKCDKFEATPYDYASNRAFGQIALTGRGEDLEITADFTDVASFKTWLTSNPTTVLYVSKTPTETSFTTASLITENAEIPLSNEDGVLIGKCTEQLSAEPGFHDAKIKLADTDGECYSNKIQLHVERSPQ